MLIIDFVMVYPLFKRTLGLYLSLYLKEVKGIEKIPKEGPFIIAANHESHIDPFLLGVIVVLNLNKKLYFLTRFGSREGNTGLFSKVTLFFVRPILVNWFGCIPVLKKGGSVEASVSLLKKGGIIGIYPEGRRNPSNTLLEPKTGVAAIALLSKAPVVPIGIIRSHRILPIGAIFPRFTRATIKIGKPITFDNYYGKEKDRNILKKVTNTVMLEIAKLCGKKYVTL